MSSLNESRGRDVFNSLFDSSIEFLVLHLVLCLTKSLYFSVCLLCSIFFLGLSVWIMFSVLYAFVFFWSLICGLLWFWPSHHNAERQLNLFLLLFHFYMPLSNMHTHAESQNSPPVLSNSLVAPQSLFMHVCCLVASNYWLIITW